MLRTLVADKDIKTSYDFLPVVNHCSKSMSVTGRVSTSSPLNADFQYGHISSSCGIDARDCHVD